MRPPPNPQYVIAYGKHRQRIEIVLIKFPAATELVSQWEHRHNYTVATECGDLGDSLKQLHFPLQGVHPYYPVHVHWKVCGSNQEPTFASACAFVWLT
jgi:hypothetical protein